MKQHHQHINITRTTEQQVHNNRETTTQKHDSNYTTQQTKTTTQYQYAITKTFSIFSMLFHVINALNY